MTVTVTHLGTPTNYSTVAAAVNAALTGDLVEVDDDVPVYYDEKIIFTNKTNVTLRPKAGATPVISGAIGVLVNSPSGQWTFHETNTGKSIYRRTLTGDPFSVQGLLISSGLRLFTHNSYANLIAFSYSGLYHDAATDRIYIWLSGNVNPNTLSMKISFGDYVIALKDSSDCIIEDLTFEVGGEAVIRLVGSSDNTIRGNNFSIGQRGLWMKSNASDLCAGNIIEDNTFWDTWDDVNWTYGAIKTSGTPHHMETIAVNQSTPGTDNIIRNNTVYGVHHGILIARAVSGSPFLDGTKIYGNTLYSIRGDSISFENYVQNVEAYDNLAYETKVGFSFGPLFNGPVHFYRNIIICDIDLSAAYTVGAGGTRYTNRSAGDDVPEINIYHNTFYSDGVGFNVNNSAPAITNMRILNNIFITTSGATVSGSPIYTDAGNDMDGNIHYRLSPSGNLLTDFATQGTNYASLSAFKASAPGIASDWEASGQEGNPNVNMGTYPYPLTLTTPSSIAVDAGVALPVGLPDATIYAGDRTVGAIPNQTDPPPPSGSGNAGLVRAASLVTTGNQTFRDPSMLMTPKAAIFIVTYATTDEVLAAHSFLSFGVATGTGERWASAYHDQDAVATTVVARRTIDTGCICIISGGTVVAQADFVSFEVDAGAGAGVTINWSNAPESAFLVTVIMIAGDNAKAGTLTTGAAANDTVATTVGFLLSFVIFSSTGIAIPASAGGLDRSFGVGLADLTQRCWIDRSTNGNGASAVSSRYMTNRVAGDIDASAVMEWDLELTAVDATSFTVTQRTAGGASDEVGYLAVNLGALGCWLGDTDTPTATGSQSQTGPGFQPELVIFGLTNMEAVDTAYTDDKAGVVGVGAFTALNEYSNLVIVDDASDPTVCKSFSNNRALAIRKDDGTAQIGANRVSMDTNGWTLNYTIVAATAKKVFALVLEKAASANAVPTLAYHYRRNR